MMYQNFGSGYTFYIENLKVQFENRFEERVKREKWASIEELIDVNEKLREKLKLKWNMIIRKLYWSLFN